MQLSIFNKIKYFKSSISNPFKSSNNYVKIKNNKTKINTNINKNFYF